MRALMQFIKERFSMKIVFKVVLAGLLLFGLVLSTAAEGS